MTVKGKQFYLFIADQMVTLVRTSGQAFGRVHYAVAEIQPHFLFEGNSLSDY